MRKKNLKMMMLKGGFSGFLRCPGAPHGSETPKNELGFTPGFIPFSRALSHQTLSAPATSVAIRGRVLAESQIYFPLPLPFKAQGSQLAIQQNSLSAQSAAKPVGPTQILQVNPRRRFVLKTDQIPLSRELGLEGAARKGELEAQGWKIRGGMRRSRAGGC